jgi:hypothetical protein
MTFLRKKKKKPLHRTVQDTEQQIFQMINSQTTRVQWCGDRSDRNKEQVPSAVLTMKLKEEHSRLRPRLRLKECIMHKG